MSLRQELKRLKNLIKEYDSCLVAFSGGVDSAFLLKIASEVIPRKNLLAVTATSCVYPKEELIFSKKFAKDLGVRHKVININLLKEKRFISNPLKRCYFCKRKIFSELKKISGRYGLKFLLDASNLSDKSDFRPGELANKELNIRSPLQEAKLSKEDIRNLSRRLGLITWDKPSLACLASRVPYGSKITHSVLKRIDSSEKYLRSLGIKQVRVRYYGKLCRIEVAKENIPFLLNKGKQIVDKLKKLGYNYVTVDLQGYRTGSLNEG
jgi:pyridinium-3,5-biscarboxylic acid mononucleotide sulfurtransferase